jgi:hypothetical protein
MKIVKTAPLIMWCHEPKRTCSATYPGSRVINPGFLRVAGKAKTEESEIMSEARDKKMKLKRRLDEEKAIRVMRACRFRRYDENR